MDYKNKYEHALEKAKIWKDKSGMPKDKQGILDDIFPELKENEDEKTKRILHSISSKMSFHLRDIFTEEEFQCFDAWSNAWLEKQGQVRCTGVGKKEATGVLKEMLDDEGMKEQKQEWSEEDEKNLEKTIWYVEKGGKLIFAKIDKLVPWLKSLKERVTPQPKQEWSEEDENEYAHILKTLNLVAKEQETKGYNNLISSINWLKFLKDRVRPQPKQEWSEEDEKMLNDIIMCGEHHCYLDARNIAWLKSFKERYTWKPSEEQMKALNYVVNLMASSESPRENDYYYNVFKDLRKQLKKLMEE